ncbi:nitrous oxide reductase family maturation protein NosD [Effusibacillus lacus]|uniref:Copper-binding protein n=1 Tax=Effusibacillus lacus TaxID=1348429 RepID=A0A292YRJ9_9BACL|nr:nitrous oxide reductase family maturation protein NosD [Effusibacillus lacus]TCS76092.1 nitrous oxidase accessory protein [Effusibacillus lacus]GAX91393.1 copper-binding protein [Effusibacillus lacus]
MRKTAALMAFVCVWFLALSRVMAESSLQSQVDQTPENGVLELSGQTYTGNIVITKPLVVKGSEGTVVRGDGTGNVITIKAPGVRLENLRIEHGGFSRNSEEEYAAVKVLSDRNLLKNLVISDSFHGIYLYYANENTIENVDVTGMSGNEIAGQGNGIQFIHSHGNKLTHSRIRGSRDGIYFYYSDRNRVEANTISQTRYGLHYMYSNDNAFSDNRFTKNTGGAAIMVSRRIRLHRNEFSFHQGPQAFGILLQESKDVEMRENRFFQNLRGLYLENSQGSRIHNNHFVHNRVGVELWASASQQVFSQNRFYKNTAPVIAVGGQSTASWSENGKGNDWGKDIPVLDLDRDGIGDHPVSYKSSLYKLVQENELAYLFLKSPAITVYEKMGQVLNRQEVMFEDPHPLPGRKPEAPALWLGGAVFVIATILWIGRRGKA